MALTGDLRRTGPRYLLVGLSLFVLDLSIFLVLVHLAGLPLAVAQVIARTIGAITGFVLHRSWTFDGEGDHRLSLGAQGGGYLTLTLLNISLSPFVVLAAAAVLPDSMVLVKVAAEGFLAVESFLITRLLFTRSEP